MQHTHKAVLLSLALITFFAFPSFSSAVSCQTSLDCSPDNSIWCNPNTHQCAIPTATTNAGSGAINMSYIQGYSNSIINIINGVLVPVLMAVAFIVFLYGVYKYFILNGASDTAHTEGRTFIIYGIVGFVVILSMWGLVGIVASTFSLSPGGHAPAVPVL